MQLKRGCFKIQKFKRRKEKGQFAIIDKKAMAQYRKFQVNAKIYIAMYNI